MVMASRHINFTPYFYVLKEAEMEQKRSERHGTLKTCKVIAFVVFSFYEMMEFTMLCVMLNLTYQHTLLESTSLWL
jgi:hypothetical protein